MEVKIELFCNVYVKLERIKAKTEEVEEARSLNRFEVEAPQERLAIISSFVIPINVGASTVIPITSSTSKEGVRKIVCRCAYSEQQVAKQGLKCVGVVCGDFSWIRTLS